MIRGSGSWSLIGWVISFAILTTIIMLLRFLSARIQKRGFYADDGFVLAAYIGMLVQQGVGIWGIVHGLGNPATDMTMDELLVQAQLVVAVSTTWIFSTTLLKLAVLGLYTRIFSTQTFKRIAMCLMAFISVFGIAFLSVFLSRCYPVSQEWDPKPWGWCRPIHESELASSSVNLVLDFIVVILPMPWLWRLQMAVSRKVFVTIMFSFGFATISIMAYRVSLIVASTANSDPMIALAEIGLLSNLELWLGIIAACMPTLTPVLRTYVQPSLVKLGQRLSRSPAPSKEQKTSQMPLGTFGGSGAGPFYGQAGQYHPGLSNKYFYTGSDSGELGLVRNEMSYSEASCGSRIENIPWQYTGYDGQRSAGV